MRRFSAPDEVSAALGVAFSDQQLAAIAAPLEPGVVIAGAGSGKTTVMAARVVWLVGTGLVRPEQVLGLTFTRKAAAELSARIRRALADAGVVDAEGFDDAGEQLVLTYDAFAARLVADHGLRIGVDAEARLLTGAARFRLASRVVTAAPGPLQHLSRLRPDSIAEKVLALDGDLASHLASTEGVLDHAAAFADAVAGAPLTRTKTVYASLRKAAVAAAERVEVAALVDDYQRLKRDLRTAEFADQMGVAARLAAEVPAVGALLREQFRVVLLDEYQDTSSAQASLLQSLFGGGHPVTAVGDPCQAIYGWRGAAAANILAFGRQFARSDGRPATPFPLTVNRRSGQRILDAANRLSLPLRADAELQWDGIDTDLVAPPGTPAGDIVTASFDTWPDEVAWIADRIAASRDTGVVRRWKDVAVLSRRNAHIRPLYAELRARGIPVEIVGLDGLLQVPEVADVVAVLRVLADATANPDLVRLLTGPRWAIGPQDLAALGRRARELVADAAAGDAAALDASGGDEADALAALRRIVAETESTLVPSLPEALADLGDGAYTPEGRSRLAAAAAELASLRRHVGDPVTDLVRRVVAVLGLEVELALAGPEGTAQLDAFVAQVAAYADVDGDGSLGGLLAWLRAEEEHGTGLEQVVLGEDDSVKLLTTHKAKGLEWELVVLPALADKVFPSDRVQGNWLTRADVLPAELRGDADHVPQLADVTDAATKDYDRALRDDARRADDRLAYVAVTRARQHLVATTHAWDAALAGARAPSAYFTALAAVADETFAAEVSPEHPLAREGGGVPWPAPLDEAERGRRLAAADEVRRARESGPSPDEVTTLDEAARLAQWDAAADVLLAEASARRRGGGEGVLPPYLSVTGLSALTADADAHLAQLARPMPAPPRRAARTGELFHAWLARHFEAAPALLDDDGDPDVPAAGLADLIAAFQRGPYAERRPVASEVPFALVLAGQVVRGRIDAVFDDGGRPQVVDWKTGPADRADPLQLALYRLAWAELHGIDPEGVDAVFVEVLTGATVRPARLPGRQELERLVTGLVANK